VSAIVAALITDGIVREVGLGPTGARAGRPPVLLEYDSEREYLAGVHIGVQRVSVMIANSRGEEVSRLQRPPLRGDDWLAPLVAAIGDGLAAAQAPRERLVAIGVCVPGLMDLQSGVCLLAPNLGWRDVPVKAGLERELGVPVYPMNTTQASVVAEAEEGVAQGASDVVLLYAGTGVGAGVLSNGRIFHGGGGLTGEVGHAPMQGEDELCSCGKRGCLETVAGGAAIARAARKTLARSAPGAASGPAVTAQAVAAAALAGSTDAQAILRRAGDALGLAAAWLVSLFDPEVLVLSGGLMAAGAPLLEPLRQRLERDTMPQHRGRLHVVQARLGGDAQVRGAVLLARQHTTAHYRVIFSG
jgi:glucokinase-like ROK family protein